MSKTDVIKNYCRQLKLSAIPAKIDALLQEAEKKDKTLLDFAQSLLGEEIQQRQENDAAKRKKAAHLPAEYNLDQYDFTASIGLSKKHLLQLRELKWLEQNFNVILMGPSGTGKTYIAAGLCFDAIINGYRAYFKSMEEITADSTENVLSDLWKYGKITTKKSMLSEREKVSYKDVVDCLKNAFKKDWTVTEIILPSKK